MPRGVRLSSWLGPALFGVFPDAVALEGSQDGKLQLAGGAGQVHAVEVEAAHVDFAGGQRLYGASTSCTSSPKRSNLSTTSTLPASIRSVIRENSGRCRYWKGGRCVGAGHA